MIHSGRGRELNKMTNYIYLTWQRKEATFVAVARRSLYYRVPSDDTLGRAPPGKPLISFATSVNLVLPFFSQSDPSPSTTTIQREG